MVQFQITGWYSNDIELEDSSSDEDEQSNDEKEFKIVIFGKDMDENTYTLLVNNFTPYFYVNVPNTFTRADKRLFEKGIREKMWHKYRSGFLRTTMHKKKNVSKFQ